MFDLDLEDFFLSFRFFFAPNDRKWAEKANDGEDLRAESKYEPLRAIHVPLVMLTFVRISRAISIHLTHKK